MYELARALHQDLTTGDVQAARHVLGAVRHGGDSIDDWDSSISPVDAYFRILWCFYRFKAGRDLMRRSTRVPSRWRRQKPCRYLDDLAAWHTQEWAENIFGKIDPESDRGLRLLLDSTIREQQQRGTDSTQVTKLDDEHSITAFKELLSDMLDDGAFKNGQTWKLSVGTGSPIPAEPRGDTPDPTP